MGFKRERSNRSDSDNKKRSRGSRFTYGKKSQAKSQSTVPTFRDQAHAEAHYGQEIESAKELHQLQRLEKRYGDRLHGWLEEGMPKAAMGHPTEMADFRIQRSLEGTGTSREDVPETVLDVLGSQGQSLDGTIQRALEDRMDADFSNVRIHTGAKAADAADAIDAKAFTCGSDIVFNSGEYDPESPEGQHLLAHELAHVKQQTGVAISMMPQEGAQLEIDPDPQLEREADEAAKQALADGPVTINRMGTDVHIQRMPGAEMLASARQQAAERFGSSDDTSVPADPEVLASEVEQLKQGQQQVMETLTEAQPGAPSDGNWLKASTKGALGSLAGLGAGALIGGTVGSVIPGVGTAAGAVAGAAVSGVASDATKESVDYFTDNRPGGKGAELERMYDEMRTMYEELKGEQVSTGTTTVAGQGGHV